MHGGAFFLLVSLLNCGPTDMQNVSGLPWTKRDDRAMKRAAEACAERFADAPCLVKFIKKEELVYHAICGSKK